MTILRRYIHVLPKCSLQPHTLQLIYGYYRSLYIEIYIKTIFYVDADNIVNHEIPARFVKSKQNQLFVLL